jgi:hypothetical protein
MAMPSSVEYRLILKSLFDKGFAGFYSTLTGKGSLQFERNLILKFFLNVRIV